MVNALSRYWTRALRIGAVGLSAVLAGCSGLQKPDYPELPVATIASSCCGMAGAFGYEAEHYDISLRMAEANLLPAVREAGPDTLIVADGTSCRHQIWDGARQHALHAAQVLVMALRRKPSLFSHSSTGFEP